MLTRVFRQFLSKRVPRDQFAYRVADPTPEHEAIDSLRNQDYPARRKQAITQFNHQLHTHNRTYKGELKASRAQAERSTTAEHDHQDT